MKTYDWTKNETTEPSLNCSCSALLKASSIHEVTVYGTLILKDSLNLYTMICKKNIQVLK